MTDGIFKHDYKEMVQKTQTHKKIGYTSLLWGLVKYPKIIVYEEFLHTKLCVRCGEREFSPVHGYHTIDSK